MIAATLGRWMASRSSTVAVAELQDAGVPAGPVQDSHELFSDDPQHRARGYWQDVDHVIFSRRTVDAFPGLWNGERWEPRLLSPAYLDEHNFEVWAEVGYSPEEIAEGVGDGLFR